MKIIKLLRLANQYIKEVLSISKQISCNYKKNRFLILIDMILCTIGLGASPNNYKNFHFYELPYKKRKTFVTHRISEKIIKKYNSLEYREIFEDKVTFAKTFNLFFDRDWLDTTEMDLDKFLKFIENKEVIIYKPIDAAQGQGIRKLDIKNFESPMNLYQYILDELPSRGIIEEWIVQHEDISRLYNKAINPVRVVTLFKEETCHFLVGGLTIGLEGDISNSCLDDLVAPIDMSTGVIKYPAENGSGEVYVNHPISNQKIEGFQIPHWEILKQTIQEASKVIPQVGYVGWDIAITPEKVIIIEGNTSPGYKYYQLWTHLENKEGNAWIYRKFL